MQRQTELDALGDSLKGKAQGKEEDRPPNRAKRRAAAARERKNPARVKLALKKRERARKRR